MEQPLTSPLSPDAYYDHDHEHRGLACRDIRQGYQNGAVTGHARRDDILAHPQASSYSISGSQLSQLLTERASACDSQNRSTQAPSGFFVEESSVSIASADSPSTITSPLARPFALQYLPDQGLCQPYHSRSLDDNGHTYGSWTAEPTGTHSGTPLPVGREHNGHPTSDLISSQFAYASGDVPYSNGTHSGDIALTQHFTSVSALMDSTDMANGSHEQSPMFPFLDTEHEHTIHLANGEIVRPTIHAMATKGFFTAQGHWTCYRRNYFALNAWYELGLMPHNSTLFVEGRPIKAFAMHLSAAIEGQEGKDVELVQYTPKRDLGLKNPVATTRVPPSQPIMNGNMNSSGNFMGLPSASYRMNDILGFPYLPLQNERDPEPPESPMSAGQESSGSSRGQFSPPPAQSPQEVARHAFDRIQFKGATQNNGKRRASQQFYVLIVELLADIRTDDATRPEWLRVASRPSDKLVVRGRSPSHYKDSDGRVNPRTGRGGSQSGPHRSSPGGGGGGGVGGHSGHGSGAGPAYSPGAPGNPGAFRPSFSYNSNHSSMSPTSVYATTSPSSLGDSMSDIKHHVEAKQHSQQHVTREELVQIQNYPDYRYYHDSMFGGGNVGGGGLLNILGKMEGQAPVISLPGVAAMDRDNKVGFVDEWSGVSGGRRSFGGFLGCDSGHGWYGGLGALQGSAEF